MRRTNTLELKPTKVQQRILRAMLVRSSAMWNVGNYQRRKAFFDNNMKLPTYTEQYHDLKTRKIYELLGSE
ncbi:MAG: hypothetical protein GF329_03600 [Candidatus Lokiarchaeota archaeon]|nr:hypothetical protein [Candidatus Lokiarchaeota archaeon]